MKHSSTFTCTLQRKFNRYWLLLVNVSVVSGMKQIAMQLI